MFCNPYSHHKEPEAKTVTYRSHNGFNNHLYHLGTAKTPLLRKSAHAYTDSACLPVRRLPAYPSPRKISNVLCADPELQTKKSKFSNIFWVWGQLIDHEIGLTPQTTEMANIFTSGHRCSLSSDSNCDEHPNHIIPFRRSLFIHKDGVREHINEQSAFIDGGVIYGADDERTTALRLYDGTGRLAFTGEEHSPLMPLNTNRLPNDNPTAVAHEKFFLAGDVRANENPLLTSLHTVLMREHNRRCMELIAKHPTLNGKDEFLFQKSRSWMIGLLQWITYNEWLPLIVPNIAPYTGYKSAVDPRIATEFSTVGYRFGHSMVTNDLTVVHGNDRKEIPLKDCFFNPSLVGLFGIEAFLKGNATTPAQDINLSVVDNLRNCLFGCPESGHLLDLISLNLHRGRDHGIPGYNMVRKAYGLPEAKSWSDVTCDEKIQRRMRECYVEPYDMDPYIGCLGEDKMTGFETGPLLNAILKDQFERIRDGDSFWHTLDPNLQPEEIEEIHSYDLQKLFVRNTKCTSRDLPKNIFRYSPQLVGLTGCC